MAKNIHNSTGDDPASLAEDIVTKSKLKEHERDLALKNYYKSMMGRKDIQYSQTQVCRLAVDFLYKKGFYSISSPEGIRKCLIRLKVIKGPSKISKKE